MRPRPAEIDFGLDDFAVAHRQDFRIAKALAPGRLTFIRDEHAIPLRHEVDEFEIFDRPAVRPAALEVRRAVQAVVERTGEMKIVRDQRLDGCPVLRDVGFVTRASDRFRLVGYSRAPAGCGRNLSRCDRTGM